MASMALCLPNAGVGVGASTGNPVAETESILGPRIDINTHHGGVTGSSCGSSKNHGVILRTDGYHPSLPNSIGVNPSISTNNSNISDIGDENPNHDLDGTNGNDNEVKCSVSVTVQSSASLKTSCCGDKGTLCKGGMETDMYSMDDGILNELNEASMIPTIHNISKMNVNDNLSAICGLLSAAIPSISTNGHNEVNNDGSDFDGIDLGNDEDDDSCVPLGDILEKLQAEEVVGNGLYGRNSDSPDFQMGATSPTNTSSLLTNNNNQNSTPCSMMGKFSLDNDSVPSRGHNSDNHDDTNNLIRLHAVNDTFHDGDSPTISATVNVATLDLSDPESIHQHLSQLNDTVLRVSAEPFAIRSPSPQNMNQVTTSETIFDSSTSCSSSNQDIAPLTPLDNNASLNSESPSSCSNTSTNKNMYKGNAVTFQQSSLSTTQSQKLLEPMNIEVKSEMKDGTVSDDVYGETNSMIPCTALAASQPKSFKQATSTVVGNLVSSLMSPSSQQSPGGSTGSNSTCGSNPMPPSTPFLTPSTTITLPTSPVHVSISLPNSPCPIVGPSSINHTTLNKNNSIVSSSLPSPTPSIHSGTPNNTPTSSPMLSRRSSSSSGSKNCTSGSQAACAVCFKTFSNASALAKHRLTHSEERRYHCTICSKAFKRQDHLNGHLLTHRSTKPFACQVDGCGKSYCDARSLRRHKENHHNQKNKKDEPAQSNNGKISMSQSTSRSTNSLTTHGTSVTTANSAILTINTDKPNITNLSSASKIENNASDHLITTCKPVLGGDTKVKFSSKGLTEQQLKIIHKIFKETKADISNNSIPSTIQPKNGTHSDTFNSLQLTDPSSSSAALVAAKALAAVQSPPKGPVGNVANCPTGLQRQKSQDRTTGSSTGSVTESGKPVECGICNRRFKNVPALNGHMRLHGGYYKKDEHGKRITSLSERRTKSTSLTNNSTGKLGGNKIDRHSAAGMLGSKRKLPSHQRQNSKPANSSPSNPSNNITSPGGGLSVFPAGNAINGEGNQLNSSQSMTGSSLSISPLNSAIRSGGVLVQPNSNWSSSTALNSPVLSASNSFEPPLKRPLISTDPPLSGILCQNSSQPPSPSLAFCSLPPPDTNRLLANLELKAAQQQQLLTISNPSHPITTYNGNLSSDTEVAGAIARNTSIISSSPNHSPTVLKAMEFCKASLLDSSSNKSLQITPTLLTTSTTSNKTMSISEMPLHSSGLQISPVAFGSRPKTNSNPISTHHGSCSASVSLPTMPLPVSSVGSANTTSMRLPDTIASLMTSSSLSLPKIITSRIDHFKNENQLANPNLSPNGFVSSHAKPFGQSSLISTIKTPPGATSNMIQGYHNNSRISTTIENPLASSCLSTPLLNSLDSSFGAQCTNKSHHNSTPKPCLNMLKVDNSTDKSPKTGSDHQAEIPELIKTEINDEITEIDCLEDKPTCKLSLSDGMRWDPIFSEHIPDEEMSQYLVLASSCMVSGGSHNEEFALELLGKHSGDLRCAIKDLLSPYNHPPTNDMQSNRWLESEVDLFYEGLVKHHKNFFKISSDIKTKSTKECIEFYYLWKNVCQEEAQSFKNIFQVSESFTEVKSLSEHY